MTIDPYGRKAFKGAIFVPFPFELLKAGGSGGVIYDRVGSLRTP